MTDLANEPWKTLKPLIPVNPCLVGGNGRRWRDSREVVTGILWVLLTLFARKGMPAKYLPYQTCYRKFQHWAQQGVAKSILSALAQDLAARGKIDLSENFIDTRFIQGKKGVRASGRPSGVRVERSR